MTDKFVQVQSPKSGRYALINKTKGQIKEISKDENPFPDVEIIDRGEARERSNGAIRLMRNLGPNARIEARKNPFHRTSMCIRRIYIMDIQSINRLDYRLTGIKDFMAKVKERKQNTAKRVAVSVHCSVDDSTGAYKVDGTVTAYFSDMAAAAEIKNTKAAQRQVAYAKAYGMGEGKIVTFDSEENIKAKFADLKKGFQYVGEKINKTVTADIEVMDRFKKYHNKDLEPIFYHGGNLSDAVMQSNNGVSDLARAIGGIPPWAKTLDEKGKSDYEYFSTSEISMGSPELVSKNNIPVHQVVGRCHRKPIPYSRKISVPVTNSISSDGMYTADKGHVNPNQVPDTISHDGMISSRSMTTTPIFSADDFAAVQRGILGRYHWKPGDNPRAEVKTFGDAVNKALDEQQSPADKAYVKFKTDEKAHADELMRVLLAISSSVKPVTAHDVNTPMVNMWELLQKGCIKDVTPRGKTGGLMSPDTTYTYVLSSPARL